MNGRPMGNSNLLPIILVVAVTVVWMSLNGRALLDPTFHVDTEVHAIFGAVIGSVFGVGYMFRKDQRNGNGVKSGS